MGKVSRKLRQVLAVMLTAGMVASSLPDSMVAFAAEPVEALTEDRTEENTSTAETVEEEPVESTASETESAGEEIKEEASAEEETAVENIVTDAAEGSTTTYRCFKKDGTTVDYTTMGDVNTALAGTECEGYVTIVQEGTSVTVTPVANTGYEFMVLSLVDATTGQTASGWASTPLTKDYKKDSSWNETATAGDYSFTFTVDGNETLASVPDGKYTQMPEIKVLFDATGDLLNDELMSMTPVDKQQTKTDSVTSWLGGTNSSNQSYGELHVGSSSDAGAWVGVDSGDKDYVTYYAGDNQVFLLNAVSIYSRCKWSGDNDKRFNALIEGSNDGTTYETILQTARGQNSEKYSIIRNTTSGEKKYSYLRLYSRGAYTDISLLKLFGSIVSAEADTATVEYQCFKDGAVVKTYSTLADMQADTATEYEGYAEVKTTDQSVTVTVTAKEGYDFMLLNLTDENGNVTTPLSKDYVKTGVAGDAGKGSANKITDNTYTYTFTVDAAQETDVTSGGIGMVYKTMPAITVYFDKQGELINDELLSLTPIDSKITNAEKSITSWLDTTTATLNAGKEAWDGKDIANGDYITYDAGEGNAFCLTGLSIYSRRNWSDTRFTAVIEASNDGINYVPIFTTEKAAANEKYSIKRMTSAGEFKVKKLRLKATANNTDITLLKLFGTVAEVQDADLSKLGDFPDISETSVIINEITSDAGFIHPGVGITKKELENVRTQVKEQKEPWYSYYQNMVLNSKYASREFACNNSEDGVNPLDDKYDTQGMKNRAAEDGERAFTQALLYVITGDEVYRENAMKIVRVWEKMDPAKYQYFVDAHIHTGYGLYRMIQAAEILRYTECATETLKWTDEDTAKFTANVVDPAVNTFMDFNDKFMNQHNFPLYGTLAAAIFKDDLAEYQEKVEWTTVNSTAPDPNYTGSVKWLYRMMTQNEMTGEALDPADYHVQLIEMGRDLAHAGDDVENLPVLARMIDLQGTKVDPENGTVSTDAGAVNIYEFLDNRILKATDYFCRFDMGYDVNWTPAKTRNESEESPANYYPIPSDEYRGRLYPVDLSDLYYVYIYRLGYTEQQLEELAPYYVKAFKEKYGPLYYATSSGENTDLEKLLMDGGWLYIPAEAATDGNTTAQAVSPSCPDSNKYIFEPERQYSIIDGTNAILESTANISTENESGTGYIHTTASQNETLFAVYNISLINRLASSSLVSLRIRTNGNAVLEIKKDADSEPFHVLSLPDTKNEWRNIVFDMSYNTVTAGQYPKDTHLMYFNVVGNGTTVDVEHINVNAAKKISAPEFNNFKESTVEVAVVAGEEISYDFSATDSGSLTYELQGDALSGAALDTTNGTFTWTPGEEQKGNYNCYVVVSDGDTLSILNLKISVEGSRADAVQKVCDRVDWNKEYLSVTVDDFNKAKAEVLALPETAAAAEFYAALDKLIQAVEALEELNPLLADGSLDFPKMIKDTSLAAGKAESLVDNNAVTFSGDLTIKYFTIDFGAYYRVKVSSFKVQPRNIWPDRLAGCVILGSVDGENWDVLTEESPYSDNLEELQVKAEYRDKEYRYFKATTLAPYSTSEYAAKATILSLGEFRIFGTRQEISTRIREVSISTDAAALTNHIGDMKFVQSEPKRAMAGNTVTIDIVAKQELEELSVTIAGMDAAVVDNGNQQYTASVTLTEEAAAYNAGKNAIFNISYKYRDSENGNELVTVTDVTTTTDGTAVFVSDDTGYIDITNRYYYSSWNNDGTERKDQAAIAKEIGNITDSNTKTVSDARQADGSAYGSYIIIDFGENTGVSLSRIEVLGRLDQLARSTGMYIQGSNDYDDTAKAGTWTTLSNSSLYIPVWQGLEVTDHRYYRYIRFINDSNWYGNISELRFYGKETTDLTNAVDTTELRQLVEQAKSINTEGCQTKAKNAFEKALQEAESGLLDTSLKQAQIDVLYEQLKAAIEGLKAITGDAAALKTLIEQAEKIDLTEYRADGKEDFEKALVAAKAGAADDSLTQEELDKLCEQLQASMDKLEKAPLYRIIFHSMGGSAIANMEVVEGKTFEAPVPVREGYTFRGWFTDKNCTQRYDFTKAVTGNLVLYAGWNTVPNEQGIQVEEVSARIYTGKAIKPQLKVYDGNKLLVVNRDYTLKYKNNINASAVETETGKVCDGFDETKKPTVVITGKGDYKEFYEVEFDIYAKDLESEEIAISYVDAYTSVQKGKQKISLTVKDGKKSLKADRDYTVTYYNADKTETKTEDELKNPGNYVMVVAGKEGSNYCGSVELGFVVVSADDKTPMSKAKITIASKAKKQSWQNGNPVTLPEEAITVKVGRKKLTINEDYTISYANNCEVGKAVLIVTAVSGDGKQYVGSKKAEFQITGTPLSKVTLVGFEKSFDYTGSEMKQNGVVFTDTKKTEQQVLVEGEDYIAAYSNHINAGKATVVYTGINGYTGSVKKTYKINPVNLEGNSEIKVNETGTVITAVYTLKGAEPKVEVKWKDTVLTEGEDYTLTYSNNKKAADATASKAPSITVKGKGNFKGTLKNVITFTITRQNMSDAVAEGSLTAVCTDVLYAGKKADSYKYNTKVTVYDNGKKLSAKNYTVVYEGNTQAEIKEQLSAGNTVEIPVTITAKENNANYTGSFTASFRITPKSLKGAKLESAILPQVYTGEEIRLTPDTLKIKDKEGTPLTVNVDYVITGYKNNVKTGSGAKVTVQGIGKYSGTAAFKFKIEKKALEKR